MSTGDNSSGLGRPQTRGSRAKESHSGPAYRGFREKHIVGNKQASAQVNTVTNRFSSNPDYAGATEKYVRKPPDTHWAQPDRKKNSEPSKKNKRKTQSRN